MNYRTTCPHCTSIFRLGTDQLEAAQGWAQCSVCGAAFNARLSLLLEDGSPLPLVEPEPVESIPPLDEAPPPPENKIPEAEAEAAIQTAQEQEAVEAIPGSGDVVVADTPQGIVQRQTSDDLPSIILIDPSIPVSDDPGPLPHIYKPNYAYDPSASAYPHIPDVFTPPPPIARIEYATAMPGTARVPPAPRRVRTWIWGVSSTLLAGVLLAQTTYFLRNTLVSWLPELRPGFVQACAVIGCTLSLPKNLAQLQIVGSDLQTETKGRLKLTLTLGNRANHAQAWPVLVLTLTDQRNRPLARRSFAPSEYLEDPQRIAAGIPPRSEQPLSLPLSVDNLKAMGFDLQLTY
jgi:predicted Zn finger-like uncharacterized protein